MAAIDVLTFNKKHSRADMLGRAGNAFGTGVLSVNGIDLLPEKAYRQSLSTLVLPQ